MKLAALGVAALDRLVAAHLEHCTGGLDGGEAPAREAPRQIGDFLASAGTDAQNPGVGWKVGKHGFQKEMQGLANRRGSRPALVVAGCLLVEDGLDFIVAHGGFPRRLFRMGA